MIAELGLFSLVVALLCAILLTTIPAIGVFKNNDALMESASFYSKLLFAFIALSYCSLTICFLRDDFTVIYVVSNSSLQLPWFYKLCAVWGGHEGSMLLWVSILSFWTLGVSMFSRSLPLEMRARVLSVLGMLCIGFLLFLLMTSNPFLRQFDVLNTPGRDLNPLLQDPGFLFHPPMLYMGYVGFSVAFAFAIAALWAGDVQSSWSKWTRPWTLAAWCCLTAGITLGSWWAYRELGWGGWWFWDPVENASFMPWLVGTALIHSLAVSEKRKQFKAWTMLLAISAFSLSLIGTFLVRSGVLTSVHAFAVDPQRGLYILLFLMTVIGGSLLLFSFRAKTLHDEIKPSYFSKESALLLNNVFLAVAMLCVLMGTIYPLIIDGLGLGKLSVGAPYFNAVFVPLMIPMLLLMGAGIHMKWQKSSITDIAHLLKWPFILSIMLPLCFLWLSAPIVNFHVVLGLMLSFWIILSTGVALIKMIQARGLASVSQSFIGMVVAHIGVAITVIGISVSTGYGVQKDVKLSPGEQTALAGFQIRFMGESDLRGPNYHGARAHFEVIKNKYINYVYPEKRIYDVTNMPMTDSAIDVSPFRDVYIALGEPLDDHAWSVRLYYKPLVRWIWGGGFLILAGGFCAISDRRYYASKKNQAHYSKEVRV